MKKVLFIVLLMFVASLDSNAQSFGSKSEDSFFKVKKSPLSCGFSQNLKMDDKFSFVPDDENDTDKKRRKKKRRGRGGRGSSYENAIKCNPLLFIFGYFGAIYERKIGDQMSLSLNTAYYSNSSGALGSSFKYSGFNLSPEFRYYFNEAIERFYVAGMFNFTSIATKYEGTREEFDPNTLQLVEVPDVKKGTTTIIGGGASVGYQWIWSGFSLDVYGGAGFLSASSSGDITGSLTFGGFWPILGTAIGYAF